MSTLAADAAAPEYMPADTGTEQHIRKETAVARVRALKEERRTWEDRWKDIRDYQLPFLGEFRDTDDLVDRGRRRDVKIADGVAWMSAVAFGAGVMSGLTPPSRQWFKISYSRDEAGEDVEAMRVLDTRQKIVEYFLHRSNFYNCIHNCYMELPFGQAPLGVFASSETGIRFQNYTVGTYYLGTGAGGTVDTFARYFQMNAVQLLQQFGKDRIPQTVKDALQNNAGRYAKPFNVWWLVLPNDKRIPGMAGSGNMPYSSLYWLEGTGDGRYLYSGGFEEFPVPTARYQVVGGNVYGFGPGWYAEGDAKGLQTMKKDFLMASELLIKPPMVGPTDVRRVNLIPGGYTKEPQLGTLGVRPLFQIQSNPQWLAAEIQNAEETIKRIYSADLFLMLSNAVDAPQKTAREVMILQQEKLQQLGPVVERLQDEFLSPIIERVYNILERLGAFPPIPDDVAERLADEDVKIEYISPLAQAQKMSGLVNIEQAIAFAAQMGQIWPDAVKKVDPVGTVTEYFELLGAPGRMQRSAEEVEAMIQQEQEMMAQQEQAQQQAMAAQAMAPAAQAAKNLTEAANDGNPALQSLMGINAPGGSTV